GRDAATDPQLQPPAREVVQHADFFDEPQGVIERQQVDKWSQTDTPGALRCRGEEQRRRGRHAEGRSVVLRQVVTEEAGGVRRLQELQPLLIKLMQGRLAPINPIEQSKGHLRHGVFPPLLRTAARARISRLLKKAFSCFDRLSTNGKSPTTSSLPPFALSLSKGERRVFQHPVRVVYRAPYSRLMPRSSGPYTRSGRQHARIL